MATSKPARRATHAGSWYSDNGNLDNTHLTPNPLTLVQQAQKLSKQLTDWLNVVDVKDATTRAIIAP